MTMAISPFTPERRARRAALLNYFSLFGSFSTLICCALPSVLVLLGMGTAVASLLSAAPWLVSLPPQGLDFQHRGNTDCSQLCDDLRDRAAAV
jgi:hypothetical protein